jgi:hypothetical protein
MSVRVDEITGVRFVRAPYPFAGFAGQEVLTVQFLGPLRKPTFSAGDQALLGLTPDPHYLRG